MSLNTILATTPLTSTGYHLKATGTTIGNSLIWDNGTNVGIGNTNTSYTLDVSGSLRSTTSAYFATTSGTVGIGTTSATSPLSIYYPSTSADVNYIKMEMPSWGGSVNFKKNIIWHDGGNTVGAIGMSFASNQTYMDFHSFYNTTFTTTTLMRIQGNGLIGIGTTAPSFRLSFGGDTATTIGMNQSTLGTAPALTLKGADSTTGTNNEGGAVYISAGLGTGNGATSAIIFSTAPSAGSGTTRQTLTEAARINSSGQLGVGVSPSQKFQVYNSSNGTSAAFGGTAYGVRIDNGGSFSSGRSTIYGVNNTFYGSYQPIAIGGSEIYLSIAGTDKVKVDSSGNTTTYGTLILGTSSYVGNIQWGTSGFGTSGYDAGNGKFTWQSGAGAVAGTIYYSFNADGAGARMTLTNNGNLYAAGTISAGGTKSFLIPHPLTNLKETHNLRHTSVESPQADLIYRGKLTLVNGKAQANIDEVSTMTEGTFEALCREVQCFTTNESGWDLVKGNVIGNVIYIESQNANSTDEISWMVIGERKDDYMYEGDITDENGKIIVEPLKPIEPSEPITN
jgi:hypothetical protein